MWGLYSQPSLRATQECITWLHVHGPHHNVHPEQHSPPTTMRSSPPPCVCDKVRPLTSIVLQALVDHCGHFMDIFVAWLGRAHDVLVFRNSSLYCRLEVGTFSPNCDLVIRDVQMPLCIMGDATYPLMPWLMKPSTGHLDPSTDQFNAHLNWARMQVECAFSHLKARFRCLLTHLDLGEYNIPKVAAACCDLHNTVERKGEAFLLGWGANTSHEG